MQIEICFKLLCKLHLFNCEVSGQDAMADAQQFTPAENDEVRMQRKFEIATLVSILSSTPS